MTVLFAWSKWKLSCHMYLLITLPTGYPCCLALNMTGVALSQIGNSVSSTATMGPWLFADKDSMGEGSYVCWYSCLWQCLLREYFVQIPGIPVQVHEPWNSGLKDLDLHLDTSLCRSKIRWAERIPLFRRHLRIRNFHFHDSVLQSCIHCNNQCMLKFMRCLLATNFSLLAFCSSLPKVFDL